VLIQKSILILQFHGEFQIAAFQTLSDPLVDPAIQFRTEMILPVTRFTFADEFAGFRFEVHCRVFRTTVKLQMFGQILQLILTESSAQKAAHFIDFSTQVSFHVFVEEEEHIRVILLGPAFQNVSEKWSIIYFVIHEVIGKFLDSIGMQVHEFVMIEIRYDDVLGIANDVHHLARVD